MAPCRTMVLLCLVLFLAASSSSYVAAARIGATVEMKNRKSLGFKDSLISGYLPKDIFPWVCWSLWTARNKLIFEDRKISPEESVSKAIWNAREWNSAQSVTSPPPEPPHKTLNIPDQDVLTLGFSDAAWKKETNTAAYGCIFVNKEGHIIHQESCVERHVSSPLTAEALALRWTINKALSRGYNSICFNTDRRSLLVAISSKPPPAELFGIIQDIDFLSFNFAAVSFKFIERRFNSPADHLAKAALSTFSSTP
ncbi:hypothetical protein F2Q69_00051116 [Brassica cretica]|uniref:RNase H type-1 domain-containing protein n=1 Tax=Brassica cretica TaxID=69181 RepID=A0A8S9PYN3_BRACR|nr:hypothetical protein F2Q69_00051116 [Brassica cretica]